MQGEQFSKKKPTEKSAGFNLSKRREQDSNLRTGFAGYTLSRRASSTTRAPLLSCKRMQRYELNLNPKNFVHIFIC